MIDTDLYHESIPARQWGVYLRKPYMREQRHHRGGVVTWINPKYNPFNFEKDDLILNVNGVRMKDFAQLIEIVRDERQLNPLMRFKVLRNDTEIDLSLDPRHD